VKLYDCVMCVCVCVKLMTQVSTKLLLPFFSFISHRQAAAAAAAAAAADDNADDAVNVLSSCIADALFPR